jgi:hypothetical protein
MRRDTLNHHGRLGGVLPGIAHLHGVDENIAGYYALRGLQFRQGRAVIGGATIGAVTM